MTDIAAQPDVSDTTEGGVPRADGETKGERTRRTLLEIAIERFGERGYRSTSVSEIARAAGLTQAAAYAYFDSKEDLFREAVDADASLLIEEVQAQAAGTPVNLLVPSIILLSIAGLDSHPLAKRILEGKEPDEIPRLVRLPAIQRVGTLIAEELTAGQEQGTVRADLDPEVTAAGVQALIMSVLFSLAQTGGAAAGGDPVDSEQAQRNQAGVVEVFDLMIRPPQ